MAQKRSWEAEKKEGKKGKLDRRTRNMDFYELKIHSLYIKRL